MTHTRRIRAMFLLVVLLAAIAVSQALHPGASAQSQSVAGKVPTFELDPAWPPKLPNNWVLGPTASMAIDRNDHVWLLNRSRRVSDDKKAHVAPPVVELDAAGTFVRAWGGPGAGYEWPDSEHGIYVDDKGAVWISGNAGPGATRAAEPWRDDDMLLKFTAEGKFVRQFGRRDQSRGNKDRNNVRGAAAMMLHRPTNELFVADGYSNRRVLVLDGDTLAFKRMWGAFGKEPVDVFPLPPVAREFTKGPVPPEGAEPGPSQYWIVHSLVVSRDGRVYVGDREYGRVQVFDLAGKYLNQILMRPADALAASISLSADPQQQFLYIADGQRRIVFVDRNTLQAVGEFTMPGLSAHHMTVDSKGNLYLSQVANGAKRLLLKGKV
jgi:hypothetical protein